MYRRECFPAQSADVDVELSIGTGDGAKKTFNSSTAVVATLIAGDVDKSEVQSIAISATGGQIKITWSGQETAALNYNATAAQVQAALEALSNIDPGDVVVSGGPGSVDGSTPYILTWAAAKGNVAAPTISSNTLTGGSKIGKGLLPGTVTVTVGEIEGVDDGAGVISGTGIAGTVDYITGAIAVTLDDAPAADTDILVTYSKISGKSSIYLNNQYKGAASLEIFGDGSAVVYGSLDNVVWTKLGHGVNHGGGIIQLGHIAQPYIEVHNDVPVALLMSVY